MCIRDSIWTGDGNQDHKISTAFSPDFVWVKRRDTTRKHVLFDKIRGDDRYLHSNNGDAETYQADILGLVSDGYELGTQAFVNTSGGTYVGWAWDGGDLATTSDTTNYDQSQVWSSLGTGTPYNSSYVWTNAFDGDKTANSPTTFPLTSQTMTWTPSSPITVNT